MAREFGVQLDPATKINHCIGTKPLLAMLPAVFIDPGDVTMMTVPGYPVAGTHTKYYGGEVYRLPLLAENDFLPDLESIPAEIRRRAKLLVINYPNSPTGKAATREFYAQVIDFALAQPDRGGARRGPRDAQLRRPAAELPANAGGPRSGRRGPLAVEGLEHDRLADGLGVRQRRIVRALADVKDNCDSGQFIAIQKAAAAALDDAEIPRRTCGQSIGGGSRSWWPRCGRCGFQCHMPGGSYFLYTPAPRAWPAGRRFPRPKRSANS